VSHTTFASDDSNRRMNASLSRRSHHLLSLLVHSSKLIAITTARRVYSVSYQYRVVTFTGINLTCNINTSISRPLRAGAIFVLFYAFVSLPRTDASRDRCKEKREVIFLARRDREYYAPHDLFAPMRSAHLECLANTGMSPFNSRLICI